MSDRAGRMAAIVLGFAVAVIGVASADAAPAQFIRVHLSAPRPAVLTAISCSSPSWCFAIGDYRGSSRSALVTLAERWNGKSWDQISAPTPVGGSPLAVGCASTSECMIVGVRSTSSGDAPYAEHWGGRKWDLVDTPSLLSYDNSLNGVSCPSSSECVAVGTTEAQTSSQDALVERWDGGSWTAERVPKAPNGVLRSVSCASSGDCWAVGLTEITPRKQTPLIVHIGKSGTQVVSSPVGSGIFGSVSCPTASTCWAVGDTGGRAFLAGLQNGSWSKFPGTNRFGETLGISCATATDCTAVGMGLTGSTQRPVPGQTFRPGGHNGPWAANWNGSSWNTAQVPSTSGTFTAVACPATTSCFAAGYIGNSGLGRALIARSQG